MIALSSIRKLYVLLGGGAGRTKNALNRYRQQTNGPRTQGILESSALNNSGIVRGGFGEVSEGYPDWRAGN